MNSKDIRVMENEGMRMYAKGHKSYGERRNENVCFCCLNFNDVIFWLNIN